MKVDDPSGSAKDDPLAGRCLGEFQIIYPIGRGGMGACVYKARQPSLDRFVAVKVLARGERADAMDCDRFLREARAAAAVTHPNIIQVHAVGEDREYLYIAMELVEGENLADTIRRERRLTPRRTVDVMKQVAAALVRAHAAGIVHRDIKPSNLLASADGSVKVADFGLAKRSGVDVSLTQPFIAVGTPLYMPPEATRGEHLDARSDLYSLGATAYHLLAGRPPFLGSTHLQLMYKHEWHRPVPLRKLAPGVPPALCEIVHRLLAKRPSERYQSAAELIGALEHLDLDAATPPEIPGAGDRGGSPARALRLLMACVLAILRGAWTRCLPIRERLRKEPVRSVLLTGALVGVALLLLVLAKPPAPTAPRATPRLRPATHDGVSTKDGDPEPPKPKTDAGIVEKPSAKTPGDPTPRPPGPKRPTLREVAAKEPPMGWRGEYVKALRVPAADHLVEETLGSFAERVAKLYRLNVIVHPKCTRSRVAPGQVAFEHGTLNRASFVERAVESADCVVALVDYALLIAPSEEDLDKAEAAKRQSIDEIPAELAVRLRIDIELEIAAGSTLEDAARIVATKARITVIVAPKCAKRTLRLHVSRMPAESALLWLARLTGTSLVYQDGMMTLIPPPAP